MYDDVAVEIDFKLGRIARSDPSGRLGRKTSREDLVQDSWVRVLRNQDRFAGREGGEIRSFFKRVVRSVLVDEGRRFARARRDAGRERPIQAVGDEVAADLSTPSRKCSRAESHAVLLAAVKTLPDDQRRAVELHHLEGKSLTETAEAMGRSLPSVAGLLRRGLETLRSRLESLKDA